MKTGDYFMIIRLDTGEAFSPYYGEKEDKSKGTWGWIDAWGTDLLKAHVWPEEHVDRFLADVPSNSWFGRALAGLELGKKLGASCACCGGRAYLDAMKEVAPGHFRCEKHVGRNPCAIEGCGRTAKDGGRPSNDDVLCMTHWKIVPKRQKLIYSRLFRLSKKRGGWTMALDRRFWRIWRKIVKDARSGVTGDLDIAEIERMFGL